MADLVAPTRSHGLVDVLDRILDKGLVVAGDIKVNLANVELLTIQIRLLICSVDKAEQIGINWWRHDPRLANQPREIAGAAEMDARLQRIENQLAALAGEGGGSAKRSGRR